MSRPRDPSSSLATKARAPSYKGRSAASPRASAAARGASRKTDTSCEVILRRALWKAGCRYRKDASSLPGRPDIAFTRARLVVFCDGDFWHGKDWVDRRRRLLKGTNAPYWIAKIERNIERDRIHTTLLQENGWTVFRFWESEIHADPGAVARRILRVLDARGHRRSRLDTTDEGRKIGAIE
ncbi:MAG TPA: very short patch repair endonuclease [Thermoanaerobaculia bacterium]|nr:very short patch repair endonuclease [Thermoanaerobaculia bacterium]